MLASLIQTVFEGYLSARLYEPFAGHIMGSIVRKQIPDAIRSETDFPSPYVIKGSVGQGNWATVPWVAIMDKRITTTTQNGTYIVFLFSEDGSTLYLTLNQGCTDLIQKLGRKDAEIQLKRLSKRAQTVLNVPDAFIIREGIATGNKYYDYGCIAAKVYRRLAMPTESELRNDLSTLYKLYEQYYMRCVNGVDKGDEAEMIYTKGFDLQEAVVLLDAYISAKQHGKTNTAAAADASVKLRNLARAKGMEIADCFRSTTGLQNRLRSIGNLYEGTESISAPGTQVFREAVDLLKKNPAEFKRLLKDAGVTPGEPVKISRTEAAVNKTKFVRTAQDQALKDIYGEGFRSVYYELKRETDGKNVRLSSTDVFIALDRKVKRKDIAEILEGASWSKKVDATPHYVFHDEERDERKAQELEDKIKATEQSFLSWLPSAIAPAFVEDVKRSLPMVSAMLQQKKLLPQSLITTTQVGQVENAARQVKRVIANKKLRNTTLRLLNAYAIYLREKKNSPVVAPAAPKVVVRDNWIRFDFTNSSAFERTIPVYCSIDGDELAGKNWSRILCAIVEREIKKGNPALADFYKQSLLANRKDRPFFLKKKIEGLNCSQLSNGAWINVNYNIPRLMELIQGFCLQCGYAKTQIVIYGVPRYAAPSKDDNPAAEANVKAVNADTALAYLKKAGLNGATVEEIIASEQPSASVYQTRKVLDEHQDVVAMPNNRYVHVECFYDLDEAQEAMETIFEAHFRQFGGYSNNQLLYGAVVNELPLFLDDNSCDNIDAVYAIARYLFEKKASAGHPFVFSVPHIFECEPDYPMTLKGLMIHQARLNDGVLLTEAAKSYLQKTQLSNPGLNTLLQIGIDDTFIMYDSEQYLLKESLGADEAWIKAMHNALDNLFRQADVAYVIPRDIRPGWLSTLPAIPHGLPWTLLLLQEVLRKFEAIGFKPIAADLHQSLDTIAAAIIPTDSPLQTFPDVVTLFMQERYELPKRMPGEDLRIELRNAGMIEGNEMIYSLYKALDDYRFAWSDENRTVYVRGN